MERLNEICDCGLLPEHKRGEHDWCCQLCGGNHTERICPQNLMDKPTNAELSVECDKCCSAGRDWNCSDCPVTDLLRRRSREAGLPYEMYMRLNFGGLILRYGRPFCFAHTRIELNEDGSCGECMNAEHIVASEMREAEAMQKAQEALEHDI